MQSMTGYGRGQCGADGRELTLEVKTVNHRFLDVAFRLPKGLAFLEEPLRRRLNESALVRGHADVSMVYRNTRQDARAVSLDTALLRACAEAFNKARGEIGYVESPSMAELTQMCGALEIAQAEDDADAVTALAMTALDEALSALMEMRLREGGALADDLAANLDAFERLAGEIEARAPLVPIAYRERLAAKLAEWGVEGVEPQRMAQEVALMADRCAIDEELSRLKSHIAQFRGMLTQQGEAGRALDFLLQEMNRETNTIGSKANDAPIAQSVVQAKRILEKLREQVQNVV